MANRLAQETSPYLLQHAENPVDWNPWDEEALQRARDEDKVILLSIGYSACHWCHVMAHESFENDAIAAQMNDLFVNIKVDREERPDIDALYMASVQAMTGHGGWPMTVFLTPEGKPFYGGTYFPPSDRGGMPGFPRVMQGVHEAYQNRRDQVLESADTMANRLGDVFRRELPPGALKPELFDNALDNLERQYDAANGGFGGAPKFPAAMTVDLLLRIHHRNGSEQALDMAHHTLDRMARGGLYDQVGGGFHRYTVDGVWLVPHFEKMLYDNALLADVYVQAYQATGEAFYRTIAEETLDYVLREMTSPEGGFYSTQDADTEGEEGKFFVWRPDEVRAVLGDGAGEVIELLGLTERGNFEGSNVLSIPQQVDRMRWREEPFVSQRQRLFDARAERTHPGRDDKILTSWNGLMMRAFANAAWMLDSQRYADAARANARFLRGNLQQHGRLLHSYKDGDARIDGFLEDYAFLIDGLLALYRATFEPDWIAWARDLARCAVEDFYDADEGAFYDTAAGGEQLIARPRDPFDNATPSGNSAVVDSLTRLAHLIGDVEFTRLARSVIEEHAGVAGEHPQGLSRLLAAADFVTGPSAEIAIVGPEGDTGREALLAALKDEYLPRVVVAVAEPRDGAAEIIDLLLSRDLVGGKAAAYVCINHACQMPVTEPEAMLAQVRKLLGIKD
jgi:uncharacterized protein